LNWLETNYLTTIFGNLEDLTLQKAIDKLPLEVALKDPSTSPVVLSLFEILLISEVSFGEIQRIEKQIKQDSEFVKQLSVVLQRLVHIAPTPVQPHEDPRTDPMLAKDYKEDISDQNRVRWVLGAVGDTRRPKVILPRIRTSGQDGAISQLLRRVTTGLRHYYVRP
jgi:hypothetical protein